MARPRIHPESMTPGDYVTLQRARDRAAGWKTITVRLSPEELAGLETLRAHHKLASLSETLRALVRQLECP